MRIRLRIIHLTALSFFLGIPAAYGQLSVGLGQRPGQMVNAGVFRAQSFGAPVQITETQRPRSNRTDFFVEAVNIIFTQINQAVDAFAALLVLRAGGTPSLPTVLPDNTTSPDPSNVTPPRRKSKAASTLKLSRRVHR